MKRLMDDFRFRDPGIKNVEYVYLYSVSVVDAAIRQKYLEQAYCLSKEFSQGIKAGWAKLELGPTW